MKPTVTIIGHKNQDSDATFACMALNNLFNKTGSLKTQVKISDNPNKETRFV
ncbi:MAG: manganese-dependent inorganic pyrophosphatase, partial [Candidatus Moranbacteria bacterium]|nr:manganese-dependent inorganic pyrophosphatase [Candidatus Moranbacteria bacterium]